jgi:alkylation response protein AidB-like acyl-CoA dehydrogenase
MLKIVAPKMCEDCADEGIQIFGGMGFVIRYHVLDF